MIGGLALFVMLNHSHIKNLAEEVGNAPKQVSPSICFQGSSSASLDHLPYIIIALLFAVLCLLDISYLAEVWFFLRN
jgi:hypothetical protein